MTFRDAVVYMGQYSRPRPRPRPRPIGLEGAMSLWDDPSTLLRRKEDAKIIFEFSWWQAFAAFASSRFQSDCGRKSRSSIRSASMSLEGSLVHLPAFIAGEETEAIRKLRPQFALTFCDRLSEVADGDERLR